MQGAALAACGFEGHQFIGTTLPEFFETQDLSHPSIAAHLRACAGESIAYQTTAWGRIWDCQVEPLHDATGTIVGTVGIALDASRRLQADAALRESRQQYEDLVNSIDGIVWEADVATTRFTFVSQQAERLLGYPIARWLEEPAFWPDHMHPDDRPWAVPFCASATAEMKPHEFEYRMIAADGRVVWLRDIVTVVCENGRPVKLRGVMVDITEKKRAEADLQNSETRFRRAFYDAPIGMGLVTPEGNFLQVNHAYCEMTGYTEAEMLQWTFQSVTHPDDVAANVEGFHRLLMGEIDRLQMEKRYIHKQGHIVWGLVSVSLVRDAQGNPMYGVAQIQDITQRKRAEAAVLEKEEQYRSIFEATSDGVMITDLDTNVVVAANPACDRMHGYPEGGMVGLMPHAYIHPDDLYLYQSYRQAVLDGGEFRCRARDIRKDGTAFNIEVYGRAFMYRGKRHALGVIRDVTEQVDAQRILETRVEERTRQLRTLLKVSENITSTLELEPLLQVALAQLKSLVDYTGARIFVVQGPDLVSLGEQTPLPEGQAHRTRWPIDQLGEPWELVSRGQTILIPDVRADTPDARHFQRLAGNELNTVMSYIGCCMWIPLIVRDRIIGVLSVTHRECGYFTERHVELAHAVARQAAIAIENAQLYEAARDRAALEERQHLARELHDSVSQALYGIVLGARTARTLLDRDPTRVAQPLDYVLSLAEAGLAEMRALIFELRPESLELEGLVAALEKQAASLRARHGLEVGLELGEEPELPLSAKEALYRIAQEATHNIVKHAQAKRVQLRLRSDGEGTTLEIEDDGVGFDPTGAFPGHLGLRSMRERVEQQHGALALISSPGAGTCVRVHFTR